MSRIVLPAFCDRGAALSLHPEFLAAFERGALTIDGTACERVGQLVLQLLLAARRTVQGTVIEPSAALRQAAELAGVAGILFDAESEGAAHDQ